jgi:hypothetical protein
MEPLRQIHEKLINTLGTVYERTHIRIHKGRVITALVGSRGVGKTTFILDYIRTQYGRSKKALYVSADHLYFSSHTLLDLAESFVNREGGELLCIDEVHRYSNWAQELKNIYDAYPELRVIISGSSSINIVEQKYDLSRRVLVEYFPGFSFREWLAFTHKQSFHPVNLSEIISLESATISDVARIRGIIGLFHQYLRTGYYPVRATLETDEDYYEALIGAAEKVINNDIGVYYSLKTKSLDAFKKILYYVATTPPGKINPYAIGKSIGKQHQEVGSYLNMMRNSSLLRYLLIDKYGHALIRNAEKIFLDNPNLAYAVGYMLGKDVFLGTIRENVVINQLQNAGYNVFHSQKGDIAVDTYTFEIGGRGMSESQLNGVKNGYVIADDLVYGSGSTIPLYLFGFLY